MLLLSSSQALEKTEKFGWALIFLELLDRFDIRLFHRVHLPKNGVLVS
jgi:hypothetical protein